MENEEDLDEGESKRRPKFHQLIINKKNTKVETKMESSPKKGNCLLFLC